MCPKQNQAPTSANSPLSREDLEQLLDTLKTIKHGSLTLIIQDGRVVQIDKNEKMRLT